MAAFGTGLALFGGHPHPVPEVQPAEAEFPDGTFVAGIRAADVVARLERAGKHIDCCEASPTGGGCCGGRQHSGGIVDQGWS